MYLVDTSKPEELASGDVIIIPGDISYDYERQAWPHPDEVEDFLARVDEVRETDSGHVVQCRYLDDGGMYLHAVIAGGDVQRLRMGA